MTKLFQKFLVLGFVGLAMPGCAPIIAGSMAAGETDQTVVSKTADYFGTTPGRLRVSNIDKGLLGTSYQTRYRGTFYNCRIYYGSVSCAEPGTGLN